MTHRPALLAATLLALAPSAASAATVWTTIATEKVMPATRARATTDARIAAARNEFEAFQVVVTGPASGVSATVSDLTGPGTISAKLYRAELISLKNASAADGMTGRVPDALIPDVDEWGEKRKAFPFDVPAGESRAIWVEVYVPRDAKPGQYEGTVTVTSSGAQQQVPVKLTVWDFELPSTSSLKSAFILGYVSLPAAHGVAGGTDAMSVLRQRYGTFGLDHRISLSKHDDGNASTTFDHFDKWYGPLVKGTANTRLPGAKLTSVQYLRGGKIPVAEWAKHAKANGWFDRLYDYTCDEPPITCTWADVKTRASAVRAVDPNFRTLVTTMIQDATEKGVADSIDVIVPVVNYMEGKPGSKYAGAQRKAYDGFLAKGGNNELWSYQSCMSHGCGGTVAIGDPSDSAQYYTGWPSYVIDSSAVRSRAQEWLSFRWGATGELYFETTMAFGHDPWSNQWDFSGNGDGTLFYPGTPAKIGGTTHIPIASIRLKMIREGMEDFEYLKRLADAGDPALAKSITEAVFPTAYTTDVSPDDLMIAREKIANRILELTGKGTTVAGVSGAPTGTGDVLAGLPSDDPMMASAGGCSSGPGNAGFLALLGIPVLLRYLYARRRKQD